MTKTPADEPGAGPPSPRRLPLPVDACAHEIGAAIRRHPVIIVRGETGSGKTTRIPQICLTIGRGTGGLIGCTQPRRVAAVTVAERVGQELGPRGGCVGWQHRFSRRTPRETTIKFMTDGILLAEIRRDPLLRHYDTIMVDEAHERTLNIDFILGCLKRILPKRRDLRVIVSSATLETGRFSAFFDDAPVIDIPGRTFPVEVRYRDPGEEADLGQAVGDGVEEALCEPDSGDILVFLPGERDIRNAADVLTGRDLPDTAVIPLMASLPPGEQKRAFQTIPGIHRIILSTNVAETSVTLPGIRTVIDSGLARISRLDPRARIKRLQIEPVSRASADQRKGRCGRIGPGICIRLYAEEDFLKRPAYTEPEIRRTSLTGLILSMFDWELGDLTGTGRDVDAIADACLAVIEPHMPLAESLVRLLMRETGTAVDASLWQENQLPPAHVMRWRIVDDTRSEVFVSRSKAEVFDFLTNSAGLPPNSLPPHLPAATAMSTFPRPAASAPRTSPTCPDPSRSVTQDRQSWPSPHLSMKPTPSASASFPHVMPLTSRTRAASCAWPPSLNTFQVGRSPPGRPPDPNPAAPASVPQRAPRSVEDSSPSPPH